MSQTKHSLAIRTIFNDVKGSNCSFDTDKLTINGLTVEFKETKSKRNYWMCREKDIDREQIIVFFNWFYNSVEIIHYSQDKRDDLLFKMNGREKIGVYGKDYKNWVIYSDQFDYMCTNFERIYFLRNFINLYRGKKIIL